MKTLYAAGRIAEVKSKVLQEDSLASNPGFTLAHPSRSLSIPSTPFPSCAALGGWTARTPSFQLWPIGKPWRERTEGERGWVIYSQALFQQVAVATKVSVPYSTPLPISVTSLQAHSGQCCLPYSQPRGSALPYCFPMPFPYPPK